MNDTDRQRRVAWVIAVAAIFCLIVGAAMGVNHFQVATYDPLTSRALTERKDLLRANPTSEELKQEIRDLDLHTRQRFFRHLAFNEMGGWLLVSGMLVVLIAARHLAAQRAVLPRPQPRLGEASFSLRQAKTGRRAVAATALLVWLLLFLFALAYHTMVPSDTQALARLPGEDGGAREAGPTWDEVRINWPQFRGPSGDGVANITNLPMDWEGLTGEGLSWKVPVPLPGFGSPVVWQDLVLLSGGNETARALFCFSSRDGRMMWQGVVPRLPAPPGPELEIQEFTGVAAPTVATDGRRVFAIFATGELVAFRLDGKLAWAKHLGVPENPYGYATSLVVHEDKLFVQYDQGQPEENKSRLYAYDAATGRVVWEQQRAMPSSWTTPIVIEAAGRHQLITTGEPWVMAYDPTTGQELWRAECLGADLAPSPVFAGGLLYVVDPNVAVIALRPDGLGDVTKTHIAWTYEESAPDITSPVTDGIHLFAVATWGTLTCLDAKTGLRVAEKELDQEFNASPILLGNRLFLVSIPGTAMLVSADASLEVMKRAELGESVHASPAVVEGRIYIRGKEHLYAIGRPQADASTLTYGP